MRKIQIGKNEANQRMTRILSKYLKEAPDSFLYRMLRKKNVLLNDRKASGKEKLLEGDEITLYLSEDTIVRFGGPSLTADTREYSQEVTDQSVLSRSLQDMIIYEDDQIIVIDKPAGVLSQKAQKSDNSLVDMVKAYMLETGSLSEEQMHTFTPGIVSRLDRNTSGLVIAGKTLPALQTLNDLVRRHALSKYYAAFVTGKITEERVLEGYWTKDRKTNTVSVSEAPSEGSKRVLTRVLPLGLGTDPESGKDVSYTRIELLTGKGHQIRAHLASVGHPLIGDQKYGAQAVPFRKGQMLHAEKIVFPEDGSVCTSCLDNVSGLFFEAGMPSDFKQAYDYYHIREN